MRSGRAIRLSIVLGLLCGVARIASAEVELDRDRFLDRLPLERAEVPQGVIVTGATVRPTFNLYLSGNRTDADEQGKADALSYEWTAISSSRRWVLALTGDLYKRAEGDGSTESGFGDTAVKVTRHFPLSEGRDRLSLQAGVALPTGADGITTDRTDEFVRAMFRQPIARGQLTWDTRVTRLGGSLASGSGRNKYRLRVAYDLELNPQDALQLDVRTTAREGFTAASGLALAYTRTATWGSITVSGIQGVSSIDRSTYVELGFQRRLGQH